MTEPSVYCKSVYFPAADIWGAHASSRAGERVLAIANFSLGSLLLTAGATERKDCFGATPQPPRETRPLPRVIIQRSHSSRGWSVYRHRGPVQRLESARAAD